MPTLEAPQLAVGELGLVTFPTLGWGVGDWIEAMLVHGPGDVQGQPIQLDDEQWLFLCHAYRLREDGRRVVKRGVFSRPKGRAKSEFAGMIACAEALGPVRFDHWDEHGEPVGKAVTSPEVLCFATEEGQAGNTYDNCTYMLRHGAAFNAYRFREPDIGLSRIVIPGGGEIRPETGASTSADGGKSTFVIFDETHLWTSRVLRQLHAVVRRNLAKRYVAQPWAMETSTMYARGEDSVAEATHLYAHQLAERGRVDASLLFDHREAPWVEDLDDDEALAAAIVHVYGAFAQFIDVEAIMDNVRDPQSTPEDSRRYWLNQASKTHNGWVDRDVWNTLGEPEALEPGELVTLGFDGAMFDDSTALIACRVEDGKLFALPAPTATGWSIWERPEGKAGEGWQVPVEEVDAVVAWAMETFQVWRLYADPPYWQDEVAGWAKTWTETVKEWWTNRDTAMAAAVERLETAIRAAAQSGSKLHDGNLTVARHVGNAITVTVRAGKLLRKERPGSPRKIDAAMAAILAYEARGDAVAAGVKKKRKRRAASL